jgi:hypothetical protein
LRTTEPILGLDVDSTIWNPTPWICEAVQEVTGGDLDLEACTTWTHVLDAYGEEAAMEIYTRVLSPERVRERDPYPGSTRVLRDLREQGVRIHFITHNWDPEDKLGILGSLGAFGMVDDRPDTIARVADAGLWAATMIQPWNRELVAERADVYGFESWHEVPDLLPPLPNGANGA